MKREPTASAPPSASTERELAAPSLFCCPRCKEPLDLVESGLSEKYPWMAKCDDCKIAFPGSTQEQAAHNLHKWEESGQQNARTELTRPAQ